MTLETKLNRKHILTVVVEDYFQVGAFSHLIPSGYWGRFETNLKRNTERTLELLAETGSQATFFSCGWIADNHPQILRRIVEEGHEIACQNYFHHRIGELSQQDFAKDVRRSRAAVEDATGQAVEGFRIGRGWIGPQDTWALDALADAGFSYDSSLRAPGAAQGVVHKHRGPLGAVTEVPASRLSILGQPLLMSGGNYMRQLPDWLIRPGVEKWIEGNQDPLVLYFHSWELEPDQPKISAASFVQQLRHYRNLEAMPDKIRYYLERYDFTSIAEHLGLTLEAASPRPSAERPAEAEQWVPEIGNGDGNIPLTLVIPCYNESETLPYLEKTLARFAAQGDGLFDLHYVLVDDGSSDDTWKLLQEYFGDRERFRLVRHEVNKGIAAALVTGFGQVRTEFLAALDADCTFSPDQLFEMMSMMEEDVDVVAASPAHAQGAMLAVPAWRSLLSRGSAFMYRCVLRHKLTSYTSCFRLYRQRAIEDITVYDPGFCGVTEILGRMDLANRKIVEYPAVLETRLLGQSKIKIFRTIAGHLRLAFRLASLRWLGRPMPEPVTAELQTSYADNSDGR
ncbi:glycosyltransferase [Pelagibius sp. Alg239-R121]|uniref:glycosyltransferase n=1 Tax=Pelagibius sp. Alg239-R121 TaxID=2993448 RepID=UPI0024A72446|nr:glycosyltransferase [Pelagibius sp. Alg239-R121]